MELTVHRVFYLVTVTETEGEMTLKILDSNPTYHYSHLFFQTPRVGPRPQVRMQRAVGHSKIKERRHWYFSRVYICCLYSVHMHPSIIHDIWRIFTWAVSITAFVPASMVQLVRPHLDDFLSLEIRWMKRLNPSFEVHETWRRA